MSFYAGVSGVVILLAINLVLFNAYYSLAQSNYVIDETNGLRFEPYKEIAYKTEIKDDRCFLIRYVDDAIYEILQYINWKKEPSYDDNVYELVRNAIRGNVSMQDVWKSKEYRKTLSTSQLGFGICVVAGLLLALIVPLFGLVIFICRCCCDRCRGKYELPKNDQEMASNTCESCSRKFHTLWLIVFLIVIAICSMMLLWVNYDLGKSADVMQKTLDDGKDDLRTYSKNVEKGYQYAISDQLQSLKDILFSKNLNKTQETLGVMIQKKIIEENPKLAEANGTLNALNNEIKQLLTFYSEVELKSSQSVHWMELLRADLKDLKEQLDETVDSCGDKCKEVPVRIDNIYPPFDNLTAGFGQLEKFLKLEADIESLVVSSNYQFKTILTETEGQVLDQSRAVNELLEEAQKTTFSTCYTDIVKQVKSISDLIPGESDDYEQVLTNDEYRGYGGYGVAAVFILILFFCLLALCCGICGYDEEATPAQRTSISHCGGITLVLVSALCFISFAFLMVLSVIGMLSGGNMKLMVCEQKSYPFIEKVIDVPNTVPGYKGSFAAEVLYNQPDRIDTKLANVLKQCQETDGSVTKTLKYDSVLGTPLLDCLSFSSDLLPKLKDAINDMKVDIKTDKLLPTEKKMNEMTTMYTSLLDEVRKEADSFLKQLDSGTIDNYSLATLSYNLKNFADNLKTSNEKSIGSEERLNIMKAQYDLQQIAKNLNALNIQYLDPIKTARDFMMKQCDTLIKRIDSIQNGEKISSSDGSSYSISSDSVKTLMQEASKTLIATSSKEYSETPWSKALEQYKERINGYASVFGDYLELEVDERVGHCKPISNIHRAIYESSCNHVLADYNQYWFFLLIATLSLIPLIFFAMKLSNYYRVLEPEDPDSFEKRFQAEGVPLKTIPQTPCRYIRFQQSYQLSTVVNDSVESIPHEYEDQEALNNRNSENGSAVPPQHNTGDPYAQFRPGPEDYETLEYKNSQSMSSSGYQPIRNLSESSSNTKHATNIC